MRWEEPAIPALLLTLVVLRRAARRDGRLPVQGLRPDTAVPEVRAEYAGTPGALIAVPHCGRFADMVKLKGDKEIGDKTTRSPAAWHPRGFEGLHDSAEVAGVEPQPGADVPQVGTAGTEPEQHAGVSEGTVAAEEMVVEGAGPLGDDAVEPSHLCYLVGPHLVTFVRD